MLKKYLGFNLLSSRPQQVSNLVLKRIWILLKYREKNSHSFNPCTISSQYKLNFIILLLPFWLMHTNISDSPPYELKDIDATVLLLIFMVFLEVNDGAQLDFASYKWLARWVNRNEIPYENEMKLRDCQTAATRYLFTWCWWIDSSLSFICCTEPSDTPFYPST